MIKIANVINGNNILYNSEYSKYLDIEAAKIVTIINTITNIKILYRLGLSPKNIRGVKYE